ncbi:ArnT family glycosyltransferase [Pseudarthrobacter sp. NPDC092202]
MSIWVMAISVRLFGLNSWSILLPQALMGILTVYLVYALVRRYMGVTTGLLGATFMAVTPVSTVMFRYNNPDALLILIMVATALVTALAIEYERPWLMALVGVMAGAGFLTKQLQIGLIVPALAITYLAFARSTWPRRLLHLGYSAAATIAVGASWLLAVQITDPADRPFIGGSTTNSSLELALGYNGLQRLTGEAAGRTLTAGTKVDALDAGYQRFLQPQFSGQFGWFLPLALAGLVIATFWLAKHQGTRGLRMVMLMCGIWFATSATVLAFMSGTLHPYYSLTAVPPLCILAATGFACLFTTAYRPSRSVLFVVLLASSTMAYATTLRSTAELPGVPLLVLGMWATASAIYLLPGSPPALHQVSTIVLLATLLTGPVLWSANTVLSPHTGAGVVAGPAIAGLRSDHPGKQQLGDELTPGHVALMFGDAPPAAVADVLRNLHPSATWVTATVGSETAANYQLELGRAVLPVGGFDGTDPFPTLEQFQHFVAEGKVGSLVIQDLPPLTLEGKGESARIVQWVRQNFPAQTTESAELYVLVRP